ncbi:MAG: tubulin-like doman-containing protein, partial [Bacteroidales bacterium]|nr:tubulin-like doman-containing protein [Bacteroidales bacterium]
IAVRGFERNERVNGWLNENLDAMEKRGELGGSLSGATRRMIGRWKLFSTEPIIIASLREIMQGLQRRIGGPTGLNKIYVIEIASLCGGTGCSAFVDVPYFVRKVLDDLHMQESMFEFYGMLELPDSKIERTPQIDASNVRARSYAAFKELEYFMRPDTEYSVKFSDKAEPFRSTKGIFNRYFLLSNTTNDIDHLTTFNRNPRNRGSSVTYLDGAVPEAINIMLSKPKEETDKMGRVNYYGFDSAMGVIGPQPKTDPHTGKNLLAATIGVSKVEIPLSEIILAIFNRLFLGLGARWEVMQDRLLLDSIIRKEILPIVGVKSLFEYIIDVLEFENLTEGDIFSQDFFKEKQNEINGISLRPDMIKQNAVFTEKIDKKIDEVYKRYGPFLILKALEEDDGYGKYVDEIFNIIATENAISGSNIQTEVTNYKNFGTGFLGLKKKEKEKKLEDLKEKIKAHFVRQDILTELKTLIDERRRIIRDDFHGKYFKRVKRMIEDLQQMLKSITKVETTTTTEQIGDTTTFSWDFSKVSYGDIHSRINNIFAKKIIIKGNNTPLFRKGKADRMEGGAKKEEVFYLSEDEGKKKPLTIKIGEETFQNVIAVEEILELDGTGVACINLEEMIRDFLNAVKKTDNADIFSLMLDNFQAIIEIFAQESFKDLIVMNSPGWNFHDSLVDFPEPEKKRLFRQSIEQYKAFAMPSFPVDSNYIGNLLSGDKRKFSVRLEPPFEPDYQLIIKDVIEKAGMKIDTIPITRDKIATMIAVNFYFDYSLSWYIQLEDCKKSYDAIKNTSEGIGLHLAEGSVEDWRAVLDKMVL